MHVSVIVGSTRARRFSEHPAKWIFKQLQEREQVEPELLDLRDYPLPFFDEAVPPSHALPGSYEGEEVRRWTKAIERSDGFIFVTPEYNYGTPAVLKNALDWVYSEWHRKPAAFVSYGGMGGARGVQQLREVTIALQMVPLRSAVHISFAAVRAHREGGNVAAELLEAQPAAVSMINDLLWWTSTLKAARSSV